MDRQPPDSEIARMARKPRKLAAFGMALLCGAGSAVYAQQPPRVLSSYAPAAASVAPAVSKPDTPVRLAQDTDTTPESAPEGGQPTGPGGSYTETRPSVETPAEGAAAAEPALGPTPLPKVN